MCIAKTPATLKDIHNAQDRPQTCNAVCMKGSYLYLVPQHSTTCLTCPTSIFLAGQLSLKIRHMSIYIAKTPATLKDSHNTQDLTNMLVVPNLKVRDDMKILEDLKDKYSPSKNLEQ